jgi:hypothetical protein
LGEDLPSDAQVVETIGADGPEKILQKIVGEVPIAVGFYSYEVMTFFEERCLPRLQRDWTGH